MRSSSNSLPCPAWLLTLNSELALLLVARGESETLAVLLPGGPDLTLYMDEAGIFVINGRKLPGILRLISYTSEINYQGIAHSNYRLNANYEIKYGFNSEIETTPTYAGSEEAHMVFNQPKLGVYKS